MGGRLGLWKAFKQGEREWNEEDGKRETWVAGRRQGGGVRAAGGYQEVAKGPVGEHGKWKEKEGVGEGGKEGEGEGWEAAGRWWCCVF